jgi:uncharacterized membrane protein YoaK (UPF0700 family)/anti-anti-sigma regulatory factor
MLSARAYSFRQKSRLAISLSWIGGYTNVVAFLAIGTLVSHVTGTATQLGHWIGAGDTARAAFFAYLLAAFTLGAALSAYMTESARRRGWRSKYVLPVTLEALLLAFLNSRLNNRGGATPEMFLYEAAGLASLAMGLQNATITKISGAVVRTTHLTGIFTDLGLEGVQYLFWWGDKLAKKRRERAGRLLRISRRHPTALRLLLLMSIAGSFGLGTVIGTVIYTHWPSLALLAPITFLIWIIYVDLRTPIADIRELDLLNDPELRLQGIITKLLPPEVVLYRASCLRGGAAHRAPDFQLWLDRVPERCRVVVLAVSPLTQFDANAVMDLEAAVERLHADERKLILSGITTHQFKALDALGVARMMDVNNLCPDLEFAIARVMAVLEEMRSRREREAELELGRV